MTERKRVDEALRNAEERYRVLFEQAPTGIVLIDAQTGRTIEANEAACTQLGYSREEFAAAASRMRVASQRADAPVPSAA